MRRGVGAGGCGIGVIRAVGGLAVGLIDGPVEDGRPKHECGDQKRRSLDFCCFIPHEKSGLHCTARAVNETIS